MKSKIVMGHLIIPEGTEEILARAYDGNGQIRSVIVPGSVKTIAERAFADCVNLTSITLCEGIESIAANAFTGCRNLKTISLPTSIKHITGWAFYDSGLQKVVLSASGQILVFCPSTVAGREYAVPSSVREIGTQAFVELPNLQHVILPEGLEIIRERAFIGCGFREITLPHNIQLVENGAFYRCLKLKTINGLPQKDRIESTTAFWRVQGVRFPAMYTTKQPPILHWQSTDFQKLAVACAANDPNSMYKMSEYFYHKAAEYPDILFYERAGNFWMYRAYQYGNQKAKQALECWITLHPEERLKIPPLSEQLSGVLQGQMLKALGFLKFEDEAEYSFSGIDPDGVVLVGKYESEDGPDEDGFGREIYYDWWFVDDCLNPIPEAPCLHSYSAFELRSKTAQKALKEVHDRTVQILRQKS